MLCSVRLSCEACRVAFGADRLRLSVMLPFFWFSQPEEVKPRTGLQEFGSCWVSHLVGIALL